MIQKFYIVKINHNGCSSIRFLGEQPTDSSLIALAKSSSFRGSIHFTWQGMLVKSEADVDFEPFGMGELALAWGIEAFDSNGGTYKGCIIKPILTGSTWINVQ